MFLQAAAFYGLWVLLILSAAFASPMEDKAGMRSNMRFVAMCFSLLGWIIVPHVLKPLTRWMKGNPQLFCLRTFMMSILWNLPAPVLAILIWAVLVILIASIGGMGP